MAKSNKERQRDFQKRRKAFGLQRVQIMMSPFEMSILTTALNLLAEDVKSHPKEYSWMGDDEVRIPLFINTWRGSKYYNEASDLRKSRARFDNEPLIPMNSEGQKAPERNLELPLEVTGVSDNKAEKKSPKKPSVTDNDKKKTVSKKPKVIDNTTVKKS